MRGCSDCSKQISARSTGRCRSCANAVRNRSPEMRAVAAKSMRQMRAEWGNGPRPEHADQMRQMYQDPLRRAHILEIGRRGRAARAIPSGYGDLAASLRRKRLPRGEVRRLLNEQIQADARRIIRENNEAMQRKEARRKAEAY